MDVAVVAQRVQRIAEVCADDAVDVAAIESALVAVRQVTSWVDAKHATLVARLDAKVSFPEATIAASSKCSLGAASKTKERAATLTATPQLADALAEGVVTAAHIDAVTRGSKQLNDEQRDELLDRVNALVDVAAAATVDEFAKRIQSEIRNIQADDGVDRLERQRRSTRLNIWTDAEGMWNLRGRFDPISGVKLAARIDATIEALFVEAVPDGCPNDPVEKQKFLAAHALARLIQQRGTGDNIGRSSRPEFVVVIDADAKGQPGPLADWPIPVEIPARILAEMSDDAEVHGVVVRNGVVLHAPGELNLGRTTRLANRAQRRALRALYPGCAVPGCSVQFDRCKLHHIVWWRHLGRTDLHNLIPLCSKHHTNVHHDGWVIELGSNRELTLRFPDGTIRNTGPPCRRVA